MQRRCRLPVRVESHGWPTHQPADRDNAVMIGAKGVGGRGGTGARRRNREPRDRTGAFTQCTDKQCGSHHPFTLDENWGGKRSLL
jgi:hypothetical protein